MITIKDFESSRKYPSCCMKCPMTVIANNGIRFCRELDKYIPDDTKRMDDCPFNEMEDKNRNDD